MPSLWKPDNNASGYFTYLSEFKDTWDGLVVIEEILIAIITTAALIGNVLMLVVTCRQARPLAVVNLLLANQCTSDLLIVLTNPIVMVTRVTRHWVLGDVTCKIQNYLQYATVATSVWTMMALSVDRYVAVCGRRATPSPIRPHVWKVMAATWVMGLGWFSPFLVGFRAMSIRQDGVTYTWCYLVWPEGVDGLAFIIASGVFVLALPLCVIVVCYARVLSTVRQSSKRVSTMTQRAPEPRQGWGGVRGGSRRRLMERKLTTMLIYLVVLFVLMWFPFFAFTVAILFMNETSSTMYLWFLLLPVSNTAINPLLIIYFNPKYRHCVATLLSPCLCRCCYRQQTESREPAIQQVDHRDRENKNSLHVRQVSTVMPTCEYDTKVSVVVVNAKRFGE